MCGLFGHLIPAGGPDLGKSRDALHTLKHRGPDQWSDWHDAKLYIGHRRLSILDLSENGRQPMSSPDGAIIISVNGEIYNFAELRKELEGKYEFRSGSDSEVVLHGFREWGLNLLLEKIDGMYAIQIYDTREHILHLARDRYGIKPLFYSTVGGGLAWASELKALVRFHGPSALEEDYTALYDFLTYRYIPAPKTMYRNVFKLEPGTALSLRTEPGASVRLHRYWSLQPRERPIGREEAEIEFRRLLDHSVGEQMVADVPVGFFLSGGLDSSSVVASAAEGGRLLHTFSIGFTDVKHDETRFAAIVAERFGTDHQRKILGSDATLGMFPRLKEWYDEPFADLSAFPSYLVASTARAAVTVVLTGDGGDEICGGYKWYEHFHAREVALRGTRHPLARWTGRIKSRLPGQVRRGIGLLERKLLLCDIDLIAKYMGGMVGGEKEAYARAWGIPDDYDDLWYFRKHYRRDLPIRTRLQLLDFNTYLPDDILTKVDRVTMAVSLEARLPLLSLGLVEFCFSLPESVRYADGELKGLMKSAMRDRLPPEIVQRDKKGFSIPNKTWKNELVDGFGTDIQKVLHGTFGIPQP